MLIKWGSIVVEGSGKLGGHVFYKGKGDAVIRTLARARNPQTRSQQTIKSRFTKLTQDWSNLTDDQRQSWNEATSSFSRKNRFGDVVLLTGKNLYNSLNQQLLITNQPMLSFAPMPQFLGKNVVTSMLFKLSNSRLIVRGKFTPNEIYVILGTGMVSDGTSSVSDRLRIINVVTADINGLILKNFDNTGIDYIKIFGEPKRTKKYFGACYSVNESGQVTPISQVIMGVTN